MKKIAAPFAAEEEPRADHPKNCTADRF